MTQNHSRFRRPQLPLPVLDQLAEQHILQAQQSGAFDDLPGAGTPLELDDDAMVPEELRTAYRILKNSGYVPAEVEALRDLREVELMLEQERDETRRNELIGKLNLLLTRAGIARKRNLAVEHDYFQKIVEKLGARGKRY
jgi:hypothetical protein